jgi:hypothetical protein
MAILGGRRPLIPGTALDLLGYQATIDSIILTHRMIVIQFTPEQSFAGKLLPKVIRCYFCESIPTQWRWKPAELTSSEDRGDRHVLMDVSAGVYWYCKAVDQVERFSLFDYFSAGALTKSPKTSSKQLIASDQHALAELPLAGAAMRLFCAVNCGSIVVWEIILPDSCAGNTSVFLVCRECVSPPLHWERTLHGLEVIKVTCENYLILDRRSGFDTVCKSWSLRDRFDIREFLVSGNDYFL